MKNFIFSLISILALSVNIYGAESHVLEFNIKGGGTNLPATVKRSIENNTVNLLTMLSDAQARDSKTLNFNGIPISEEAKKTILQLWKFKPLRVWADDDVKPLIEENLLNMPSLKSYQIRNIPVQLFSRENPGKDKYSEVSIVFSTNGRIEDFNISIDKHQYDKLTKDAITVQDKENRTMIAHWMDQLRMAYENHNLALLNSLFDDDALVITGVKTSKRTGSDVKFANLETYDYYVKNKKQYMASMKRVFANNKEIFVSFKDQKYAANTTYLITDSNGEEVPRYYMVWCTQDWQATKYSDKGKLFVLWDFKDPERPTILARAWTHPDDPKQFSDDDFILRK